QLAASAAEQLAVAIDGVRADQAALQDAVTRATVDAADRLREAVDQVRVRTADDRDFLQQELSAVLNTLGDEVRSGAEEQRRIGAEMTASAEGQAQRLHADLEQLRSKMEGDREATVDALTALLTTKHDQLDRVLGSQRARLDAFDDRLEAIVVALRAEHERLAETVVERFENAATALDAARHRHDVTRADTLEERVEGLKTKIDETLTGLKRDQAALSAALAAKVDAATAGLDEAESRFAAQAAEERTRWRSELTELLDTFGQAFRFMSEDQEQQLEKGIQSIRSDVARALERARNAPPG
ncbi:MAG TPA: hypothetical protein VGH93_01820, partial [Solirubrobacteraceae bacterium]